MAQSPSTVWRVSMARTRTDWPIVGAAWLIMVLAATLLAIGPIYSGAVSVAGLHRVLADADVRSANLGVHVRAPLDEVQRTDAAVTGTLDETLGPYAPATYLRAESSSFALPDQGEDVRDLTVLVHADRLEQHATLVAGSWPSAPAAEGTPGVAVSEEAASILGVAVDDELGLVSRLDETLTPTVRVEALFRVNDPSDPYWWDEDLPLSGVQQGEQYRTIGPLFTSLEAVVGNAGSESVGLDWHVFPDFAELGVSEVGGLRAALAELPARLEVALPGLSPTMETDLGEMLAGSQRSLLVSRTGVLLLIVQLAVLAAYAIVLTAGLLVEHRRVDTALLRSRGAGPLQVAGLSLIEGLLLAVPAALLAPWLAVGAVQLLNVAGPLAEIGLVVAPEVSLESQVAAGVAAGVCALLLVLPAFLSARSFAAEEGGRSRHETRTIGQRLGIDIALLAMTVVALWQLRLYGAPLTRNVRGTLGLDPLLVAAPAIGLLAGGVLALRLLPLLAAGLETLVTRGRHLVGALGARQLSRRPLRYTRAALLLMLAVSMGVFAVSYHATWSRSQVDQAAYQVGTDVRFTPSQRSGSLPEWAIGAAVRKDEDVLAAAPLSRERIELSRSARSGWLIGLDAGAVQLLSTPEDLSGRRWEELLDPLVGARPEIEVVRLPTAPARLRVQAEVTIEHMEHQVFDGETGDFEMEAVDPQVLIGEEIVGATVVLRDADGLLHRFEGDLAPLGEAVSVVEVPVGMDADAASPPLELVRLELRLLLPDDVRADDGRVGLIGLEASAGGESWQAIDLAAASGWVTTYMGPQGNVVPTSTEDLDGLTVSLGDERPLFGAGLTGSRPSAIRYLARSVAGLASDPLPVIVNDELLRRTQLDVGDSLAVRLDGATRELAITTAVQSFPTTDPDEPALVADGPTLALQRLANAGTVTAPEEWWLDVREGAAPAVGERLRTGPLRAEDVLVREERLSALSADPVALGIIGALSIGFVVAGLFAVIGLAVSAAVLARQRRTEFALLRALGLSGSQLSRWLWLENGALVLVSMLAGTLLGLAIGWVALPSITVTQGGEAPYPPVLLDVPWLRIGVLEAVSIGALVLTVVVLAAVLRRAGIGSVLRMGED